MKRVACLSTIKTTDKDEKISTNSLVEIYNASRAYTKQHTVTGVFLVADNTLLQILEGELESLSRVLYQHNRDPRIESVSVIANYSTEKALFQGWTIRFVKKSAGQRQAFLGKLGNLLAPYIKFRDDGDRTRLSHFFDDSANEPTLEKPTTNVVDFQKATGALDFSGKTLSLRSWPKPSQMRFSPQLMKLCSRLVNKPTSYEHLLTLGIFDDPIPLQTHLNALNKQDLLVVDDGSTETASEPVSAAPKKTAGDRFSSVLRRFIATAKS